LHLPSSFEWALTDFNVGDLHFLVFLAVGVLLGDRVARERGGHGLAGLADLVGLFVGVAVADEDPAVAVLVDEHDVVAGGGDARAGGALGFAGDGLGGVGFGRGRRRRVGRGGGVGPQGQRRDAEYQRQPTVRPLQSLRYSE